MATVLALVAPTRAMSATPWEHDPNQSHDYRLDTTDGEGFEVEVGPSGFVWPEIPAQTDTVFLELDLDAKSGQPWIEFGAGSDRHRQYFVARAKGRRYLNLSPLLAARPRSGEQISLAGHRARWRSGKVTMTAYGSARLDQSSRVLVVAPHPDDAEIGAFGVYHDTDADVVTVTAGDAGGHNFRVLYPDDASHFRVKGQIRTWDSITVPFFGGVMPGRARNLGYFDATLKKVWVERPGRVAPPLAEIPSDDYYRGFNLPEAGLDRAMSSTWPSLVADMEAEIERVGAKILVAPHPFLDGHWDHQFTTLALIEAIERVGCDGCELYLYTNHPIEEELYPVGPRDGIAGLSPWYGRPLEFARLYSHPVDEETLKLKLVALEAMHDLRAFDLGDQRKSLGRMTKELAVETGRRITGKRRADYSYYRRAGRPNEIFYVLSVEQAKTMKRRFLEDCGASAPCRPPS